MLINLLINYGFTTFYLCTLTHVRYVMLGNFSPMMYYFIGYTLMQIPCAYLVDKYNIYFVASVCAFANSIVAYFLIQFILSGDYGMMYTFLSLIFGILSAPGFLATCSIFLYSPKPKNLNIPNIGALLLTVVFSMLSSRYGAVGDVLDNIQPYLLLVVGAAFGGYYLAERAGKVTSIVVKPAKVAGGGELATELLQPSVILICIATATAGFLIYTYAGFIYPTILKCKLGSSFDTDFYQGLHKLGFAISFILPLIYESLNLITLGTALMLATLIVFLSQVFIGFSPVLGYLVPVIAVSILNAESMRFTLLLTRSKSHKTTKSAILNCAHLTFGMVGVAMVTQLAKYMHMDTLAIGYYIAIAFAVLTLVTGLLGYQMSTPTNKIGGPKEKGSYNRPNNSYNRFRR